MHQNYDYFTVHFYFIIEIVFSTQLFYWKKACLYSYYYAFIYNLAVMVCVEYISLRIV